MSQRRIRRGDGLGAVAAFCGLAAAVVFGGLGGVHASRAETVYSRQPPSWHAVETANFRVLNYGTRPLDSKAANACEQLRKRLFDRWHETSTAWTPKCEIILHPTRDAYLREVGAGGRNTLGSAWIERHEGTIRSRRIDICATGDGWIDSVLGHEMTHVVLADRFTRVPVPRWVDEGAAILADSHEKQGRHRQDLDRALAERAVFRVHELVSLGDYPGNGRWGTFYGQSASLVAFLLRHGGEQTFLSFVETALTAGYDHAAMQLYDCSLAELERRWHAQARTAVSAVDQSSRPGQPAPSQLAAATSSSP